MTSPAPLTLSKHHGAGNDFLVVVDPEGRWPLGPSAVRALCDRRRGVGADGLIRVLAGSHGADVTMELTNADGSPAEMSGNGIRCLAQAAVLAGLVAPPRFTVATVAGPRTVEYVPGEDPDEASAASAMGVPVLGGDRSPPAGARRAVAVDLGNPHVVVLVADPDAVDLVAEGRSVQAGEPSGANVEFVAVDGTDRLRLRVLERGAGETLACGTGSVAAAAAARSWGLVGDRVTVANPGGDLEVTLTDGEAVLRGPVRRVAEVTVPAGLFDGRGGR